MSESSRTDAAERLTTRHTFFLPPPPIPTSLSPLTCTRDRRHSDTCSSVCATLFPILATHRHTHITSSTQRITSTYPPLACHPSIANLTHDDTRPAYLDKPSVLLPPLSVYHRHECDGLSRRDTGRAVPQHRGSIALPYNTAQHNLTPPTVTLHSPPLHSDSSV